MNANRFDAEITRMGRMAADLEPRSTSADRQVWQAAAELPLHRRYRVDTGSVSVEADWSDLGEEPANHVALLVSDDRPGGDPADLPPFVELFFHDAFLLFNLAVPGSFGGLVATAGGPFRVRELSLDPQLFEYAWVAATRNGWPRIESLPLADIVRWYESLRIETSQLADGAEARVLFHLLHLARQAELDDSSVLRLVQSLELLFDAPVGALAPRVGALLGLSPTLADGLRRLHEAREAIVGGTAPVIHPMHDDALDLRVDDASLDRTDSVDLAASIVLAALQARIRAYAVSHRPPSGPRRVK